jgi:rhodanese-related sulfurtransferase
MQTISATELQAWLNDPERKAPQVIDVREEWELALAALPFAQHIAMQTIPNTLNAIDETGAVVVVCHHGVRSYHVALFLEKQGFEHLYNLTGGIDAWSNQVDPSIARY